MNPANLFCTIRRITVSIKGFVLVAKHFFFFVLYLKNKHIFTFCLLFQLGLIYIYTRPA